MPGLSLWLITPKQDHAFNKSLKELITSTLPSNFPREPKRPFTPHVTLTSDIDPAAPGSSPQDWLNNIKLPTDFKKESNEAIIELEELEPGEAFFKKLTLRAKKETNLLKLATAVRQQALGVDAAEAEKWAKAEYAPHLSLFYGGLSKDDVQKKMGLIELQLGWEFGSLFDCCGGMLCMGANLALVDTSGEDVAEWEILAERELDYVCWKMARGLI